MHTKCVQHIYRLIIAEFKYSLDTLLPFETSETQKLTIFVLSGFQNLQTSILPRCMECRHGLAMSILSVCPSVCLSVRLSINRVHFDKTAMRKKNLSRLLHHTKDHLAWFSEKMSGWWGAILPEVIGQPAQVGANSPTLNRYSLVAPQP